MIQDLSFSVGAGEFLTIVGPSGAGKSTLLNIDRADRHGQRRRDRVQRRERDFARRADVAARASTAASATSPRTTTCCRGARTIDNVLFPLEVQGRLDDETRARADVLIARGRARRLRALLSARTVRRHAQARGADPHAGLRSADHPDGRAVRRRGCADPHPAAGRPAAGCGASGARPSSSSPTTSPRRSRSATARWCSAGSRRGSPPSTRSRFRARATCKDIFALPKALPRSTNASGRTCNDRPRLDRRDASPMRRPPRANGRCLRGGSCSPCCWCWDGSWARARSARCSSRRRSMSQRASSTIARSGQLAADVASRRLRVSALGFVIACVAGVLLPFLLRRSPRGDRGGRALHHGLDGHSQIRAGAVAHSLVRHRRPAQAGGGDADGVLHHLHHHLRGHPRRRSAPDHHGAHCRRQRDARSRARSSGNRCCRSSSPA